MESVLELPTSDNRDPQKQAIYDAQPGICRPVESEKLDREAAEAVVDGLWNEVVDLPLRPPSIRYEPENKRHVYYPWEHEITFSCKPSNTPTAHLLHELAHARLAGLGVGLYVEPHGPFFLAEFGWIWSIYADRSYGKWQKRCRNLNLRVSNNLPDLSSHSWAVVREGGRECAVRPAQRAVEIGWNIVRTFSLNIQDNHPMAL